MNLPNECFFTKRAVLIKLYIYVLLHTNSSNVHTGNSNHNTQNEDKRHEQTKHAIQHNKLKREGTRTLQNPGTDEE
jgi:hypothetical protein